MKHVGHEHPDYMRAGGLAQEGKSGQSKYSETVG